LTLYNQPPQTIIVEIYKLNLHFNPNSEDAFLWCGNNNGFYITKIGYTWLEEKKHEYNCSIVVLDMTPPFA